YDHQGLHAIVIWCDLNTSCQAPCAFPAASATFLPVNAPPTRCTLRSRSIRAAATLLQRLDVDEAIAHLISPPPNPRNPSGVTGCIVVADGKQGHPSTRAG